MSREEHQPWENPPERPDRTAEEWQEACGSTVAFVLAFGQHAGAGCNEESIAAAIRAASEARMYCVFVLADEKRRDAALAAMHDAGSKKRRASVEVVGYDEAGALSMTRDAADFEVCELSYGLIATMNALANSVSYDYDSVVALGAGPTGITCHHLFELCVDHLRHPGAGWKARR